MKNSANMMRDLSALSFENETHQLRPLSFVHDRVLRDLRGPLYDLQTSFLWLQRILVSTGDFAAH